MEFLESGAFVNSAEPSGNRSSADGSLNKQTRRCDVLVLFMVRSVIVGAVLSDAVMS